MICTWWGRLMFMSYSVRAFLGGLTILVCTPFIQNSGSWSAGHNVKTPVFDLLWLINWYRFATIYLTIFIAGLTAFVFCSYWVYHYGDLVLDIDGYEEQDRDIPFGSNSFEWPRKEQHIGRAPSDFPSYPHAFGLPERIFYSRPLLHKQKALSNQETYWLG